MTIIIISADFAAPDHVTRALSEATLSENILLNQYTRGFVRFDHLTVFDQEGYAYVSHSLGASPAG